MSQLSIDARVILTYLNDMGYRNITAEQLKEFMKDLRKLIKYEERLGAETRNIPPTIDEKSRNLFEKLHKTTTASYRAKLPEKIIPAKNISDDNKALNHKRTENYYSKHLSANKQSNINQKSKSSCTEMNRKNCTEITRKSSQIDNKNVNSIGQNIDSGRSSKLITPSIERPSSSKMWIRPKSVPPNQKTTVKSKYPKNGDSVQLYQYYKSEWDKFKPYLPGENSHADLRWEIRNKLLS